MANFQTIQYDFSANIRQLKNAKPLTDVPSERLAVYQELFFNNVTSFLEGSFPVLYSLYTLENWTHLARDFFTHHACKTPYFSEISQEFLQFLQQSYSPKSYDPPFLFELAHYEWLELALMFDKTDVEWSAYDRQSNLLESVLQLSPLAQCVTYEWAVHTISADNKPETPQKSHLIVYRAPDDDVKFIEANPVLARLFQLLQDNDKQQPPRVLLLQIAEELQHPDPDVVLQGGLQMLTRLQHLHIILGVRW